MRRILHLELQVLYPIEFILTKSFYHILLSGGGFSWADDHGAGVPMINSDTTWVKRLRNLLKMEN